VPLTRAQLFAYGVTGLPLAALGLPLYVYLPAFYTEGLAVAAAVVGAALLVARLLDVVTDPLAGWLSDRWPTGRARRKGLVLLGLPLLLLGVEQLFRPTAPVDGLYLAGWAIVAYLGWTLVAIPYTAWGAELTDDYHGRTTVSATREGFVILGTLAAILLPTVAGVAGNPAATLDVMASALWVALPATVLVTLWWVPVRPTAPPRQAWGIGLRALLDNAPMRRLLLAYVLNGIANGLPATLFILFVAHVLEARDLTGPLLALYFAAGVAGLPLWLWLARRLDKHRAWAISLWLASASFLAVPLLGAGDAAAFAVICAVSGLCLGADLVDTGGHGRGRPPARRRRARRPAVRHLGHGHQALARAGGGHRAAGARPRGLRRQCRRQRRRRAAHARPALRRAARRDQGRRGCADVGFPGGLESRLRR
jgi:Na+/melibiose symporter-like transporter